MATAEKENEVNGHPPLRKKRRLSLKLSEDRKRFATKTDEEMSKGYVPANTEKSTRWAKKCFMEWVYEVNKRPNVCPLNILELQDAETINRWIPKFIAEVRRSDGKAYTPNTTLAGLQRYMRSINDNCHKIMDKKDPRYKSIERNTRRVYTDLRKGVGAHVKHAPTITIEEEKLLWDLLFKRRRRTAYFKAISILSFKNLFFISLY